MKYVIKDYPKIKEDVSKMSNAELIKLVTCPNYNANSDAHIDNNYIFIHPNTYEKLSSFISKIDSSKKRIIASDMEAGPGGAIIGATAFPSMRAVAETKDPHLAYEMGVIAAMESRKAGFNWTYAPCCDILLNHFSPITSIRSAGEDKDEVIKYTINYMKGLQDNGMIACSKHFPGDGNTIFDQHLTTAVNNQTKDEWDKTYREVYKNIINEGIMTIMPGHIALPCYDEIDSETDSFPPASLSYNLLTKLLKEDLGFSGIIISDATEMGGFCGYINYYDACARFLMSGGDCLLFTHPHQEFIEKMLEAIENGKLTRDVLENRAYRLLCFLEEYYEKEYQLVVNKDYNEKIAEEVVSKSLKVFKDKKNILPIKPKKDLNIAHVLIAKQLNTNVVEELNKELEKYCTLTYLVDPGCGKLIECARSKKYDYIIVSTGCEQWYGTNQITLSGTIARNMMHGWTKYETPVIFIDYANPYFHEEYQNIVDTLIYTYGVNKYTSKYICKKLFG